jgi:hypothetical protein
VEDKETLSLREQLPWPPTLPTLAEYRSMAMTLPRTSPCPQLAPLETRRWRVRLDLELSCYV